MFAPYNECFSGEKGFESQLVQNGMPESIIIKVSCHKNVMLSEFVNVFWKSDSGK